MLRADGIPVQEDYAGSSGRPSGGQLQQQQQQQLMAPLLTSSSAEVRAFVGGTPVTASVQVAAAEAMERNNAMKAMENDLVSLRELFDDIAVLAAVQQDQLNVISNHIEITTNQVIGGRALHGGADEHEGDKGRGRVENRREAPKVFPEKDVLPAVHHHDHRSDRRGRRVPDQQELGNPAPVLQLPCSLYCHL